MSVFGRTLKAEEIVKLAAASHDQPSPIQDNFLFGMARPKNIVAAEVKVENADFSRGSARLGVSWSPRQDVSFYANWGQGFLPPATEELAQNPEGFGGFNRHLTFASSDGVDLGVRGMLGG